MIPALLELDTTSTHALAEALGQAAGLPSRSARSR